MDPNLNSLENYEVLLVRYASTVAQTLLNRIERMQVCKLNLYPKEKEVIVKKRRMTENKFIYNAKGSKLLGQLDLENLEVSSELLELLKDFKDAVTRISIYLIARDPPKSKKGLLVAEAYLVQEECLLQVGKKEDLTLTMIPRDSKCRSVMMTVIKITDCYAAFDAYLRKKETMNEWVAYRRLLLKEMEAEYPKMTEDLSEGDFGDSEDSDQEFGSDFEDEDAEAVELKEEDGEGVGMHAEERKEAEQQPAGSEEEKKEEQEEETDPETNSNEPATEPATTTDLDEK